jgi:hypothetical protein
LALLNIKKLGTRVFAIAFGSYVVLQGLEALRAGRLAYWNVSRRFVIYPESQIAVGIAVILVAVLPLGRMVNAFTRPYLADRHAKIHPVWRRRHGGGNQS